MSVREPVSQEEYARLLRFRAGLRRFERWSEEQAEGVGITGPQHQLLLAIRGHDERNGPTVADVATYLLLRHHSVVELVNRAAASGLVRRVPDAKDRRLVRLRLTPRGNGILRRLTRAHVDELARLGLVYEGFWDGLEPTKHLPPEQRGRA